MDRPHDLARVCVSRLLFSIGDLEPACPHRFLEAPITELTIGTLAVALTLVEISREIQKLGVSEANWALLFIAFSRMLKSFLAVMRSTRMALRGYKSYRVVHRGENVYLKHLPAPDDDAALDT